MDMRCCKLRELLYGMGEFVLQYSNGSGVHTLEIVKQKLVSLFGAAIVPMQPLVNDDGMVRAVDPEGKELVGQAVGVMVLPAVGMLWKVVKKKKTSPAGGASSLRSRGEGCRTILTRA